MNYRMVLFKPLNIAYVNNRKAACTTIKHILRRELNKYVTAENNNKTICESIALHNQDDINNFLLKNPKVKIFTFARNPYYRSLSLYRDKLNRYIKYYRPYIYTMSKLNQLMSGPSAWGNHLSKIDYAMRYIPFSAFIDGLEKHGVEFDGHFQKQSTLVGIGNIRYDYIGKIESFSDDMKSLLSKVGFTDADVINKLCDIKRNESPPSRLSRDCLDSSVKEKIYDIYRDDFINFNYDK